VVHGLSPKNGQPAAIPACRILKFFSPGGRRNRDSAAAHWESGPAHACGISPWRV
jgi:hypothetical protein